LGHSEGARKSVAKLKKCQILLDNVHKAKYALLMEQIFIIVIVFIALVVNCFWGER